jgi:hypothetical protein
MCRVAAENFRPDGVLDRGVQQPVRVFDRLHRKRRAAGASCRPQLWVPSFDL